MAKINKSKKKKVILKLLGKNKDNFDKLVKLIEDVGDWNINYLKLAKEWRVPDTTIYRWKAKILEEMPPIDPTKVGKNIISALNTSIKQCQLKIKKCDNDNDKSRYMNTLAKLSNSMTDILEKYNYKEKIADKLDLSGEITNKQMILNYNLPIEKEESKEEDIILQRNKVKSSTINSMGYDEKNNMLEVEFKNGGVYQYFDVPKNVYAETITAQSIGKTFHKSVKGVFKHKKVENE